mmetsp:Transcript_20922/g.49571  ORF Transcript_20922/g.49571 Transcript_20922/m.49571 type:complete len:94 (+) Transcript_20922:1410-1691(+)
MNTTGNHFTCHSDSNKNNELSFFVINYASSKQPHPMRLKLNQKEIKSRKTPENSKKIEMTNSMYKSNDESFNIIRIRIRIESNRNKIKQNTED